MTSGGETVFTIHILYIHPDDNILAVMSSFHFITPEKARFIKIHTLFSILVAFPKFPKNSKYVRLFLNKEISMYLSLK